MSKDVIVDRYARLYEIPYQLACLGHWVEAYCLDYSPGPPLEREDEARPGVLRWSSRSVWRGILPSALVHPFRLLRALRAFSPDLVVAASDIPHVVLGNWLAHRLERPYVVDLYDNFEGFGQARVPGMVSALRSAVRRANLVITTSEPLRELVLDGYGARGEVLAMPSSVDTTVFHPRDKAACRDSLGLPRDARLIGTAGALVREKGITVLYEAWRRLERDHPDIHLVLAGAAGPELPVPQGTRVHYLGMLPHSRVAELFCALDVGVMSVLDTAFGRYCFPQKAYEMLACGLPVVAADVGAMSNLLASTPQCLFRANDAEALARRVLAQLEYPVRPPLQILDWRTLIGALEPRLLALVQKRISTATQ